MFVRDPKLVTVPCSKWLYDTKHRVELKGSTTSPQINGLAYKGVRKFMGLRMPRMLSTNYTLCAPSGKNKLTECTVRSFATHSVTCSSVFFE